jgi:flagellar motor protein MotB
LLVDAVFALFLLLVMALFIVACLPMAARSNKFGAEAVVAQGLIGRKLAQLQQAGYGKLNGPALGQEGDGIVDGTPQEPTATQNADGARRMRFTFTRTDTLSEKLGTNIAVGEDATEGLLFLAPYPPSEIVVDGKASFPIVRATVVIRWKDSRGMPHFRSGATLIAKVKAQG